MDQSGSDLKYDDFCTKVENWVNQDEKGIKDFVFECYDTLNCDKITDESLFKFMFIVSRKEPGLDKNSNTLLKLSEHEHDMFLDLFARDFCKIS